MWWRGCAGLGGFGGFGMFPMMFFWLVLLGLAVWAIARHHHHPGPAHSCHGGYGADEAREIARRRYAKGEISQEQFTQLMKDLG